MSRGKEQKYIPGGKKTTVNHKEQGKAAKTGSRGRSVGSEHVMGVDAVKEEAKGMRGSEVPFLGKKSTNVSFAELPGSAVMYKGRKKQK